MTTVSLPPSPSAGAFAEYLRHTGRRCTPERFLVLAAAETMRGHFTVKELMEVLEKNSTHVAVATVYSTMQSLADCGIVSRLRIDNSVAVYEMTTVNHHHLVCRRCGKIKDIAMPELDDMLRTRRFSAFTPAFAALSVYGICSTCARKSRREASESKKQSKSVISKSRK